MELNLKISYHQLLAAIKELSPKDFLKLKKELANISLSNDQNHNDFVKLLANGPVMSDEQYERFLEIRKSFNQWRKN